MTAPHPFQFHQIKLNEFIGVAYKEKPIEDLFPQKKENISVNFVLANLIAVCTCHFFRGLYYPGMPGEERPRGDEVRSLFLITNLNDFTRKK